MPSSCAMNLEAIDNAVAQHNSTCGFPVAEIRMSPFEVDRLGFEDFKGIPITADPKMGSGRFRLVCEWDHESDGQRVEAVASVAA